MMLMDPTCTGLCDAVAGAPCSSLPNAASPVPPSFCTVAGCWVICVPEAPAPPITMARSMAAIPGMVTVLSMLLTVMSSAQACLSGKTRMTICSALLAS